MKSIVFGLLIIISSCKLKEPLITTQTEIYTFSPPLDSITFNIHAPDSIKPIKFLIRYSAQWDDTLIDRGIKLSARKYENSSIVEYYGGPIHFSYNRYKAIKYSIKIEISFLGYKKTILSP